MKKEILVPQRYRELEKERKEDIKKEENKEKRMK